MSSASRSPSVAWRSRLRLFVLGAFVVAGLTVCTLERFRVDETYRVWGRVRGVLARYLEPIQVRTTGVIKQIQRIDALWAAEEENRRLRSELSQARLENQQLIERVGRLERLTGLGRWAAPPQLQFLLADVTGLLARDRGAVLMINRGAEDGIAPRDPVVALGGLVGIVQMVDRDGAQVLTVRDPLFAAGAVTAQTRSRGVVRGSGLEAPLEFMPENETTPIPEGEMLITSGFENSVYPKGIEIGRITARGVNAEGYPYGLVEPSVRLDAVEEVLLVVPAHRPARGAIATTATLGQYWIGMPTPRSEQPLMGPPPPPRDEATTEPLIFRFDAPATSTLRADEPATGGLAHDDAPSTLGLGVSPLEPPEAPDA